MKIEAIVDLDDIWCDNYGETVAALVKNELKAVVKAEVKKAITSDPKLKKLIGVLTSKAAEQLTNFLIKGGE